MSKANYAASDAYSITALDIFFVVGGGGLLTLLLSGTWPRLATVTRLSSATPFTFSVFSLYTTLCGSVRLAADARYSSAMTGCKRTTWIFKVVPFKCMCYIFIKKITVGLTC